MAVDDQSIWYSTWGARSTRISSLSIAGARRTESETRVDGDLRQYRDDGCRQSRGPVWSCERPGPGEPAQDLEGRLQELEHQVATLRAALDSRDTIGMAKGILMAREKCTPEEAFRMLTRASQRENRKLAQIAAELVASNAQRAMSSG